MTRFYGKIGYAEPAVEKVLGDGVRSGVWEEKIVELKYYGDETRTARRLQDDAQINSNALADISISVLADAYALHNFMYIRYVEWNGNIWVAQNVSIVEHRMIFTVGGVYNGPTA